MTDDVSRKNISLFGIPLTISGKSAPDIAQQLTEWGTTRFPINFKCGSVFAEVLELDEQSSVSSGKLYRADTGELPLRVCYEPVGRTVIIKQDYHDIEVAALTVARQAFNLLAVLAKMHIFHAAGAVDTTGCAVLFCGPSGSGKSTVANELLPAGWRLIDEEINFVFSDDGVGAGAVNVVDIRAGKLYPLTRVYWLVQGETPKLESISSAALAARSMAFPTLEATQAMISRALARRAAILYRVKRDVMTFTRDPDAVAALLA